MPSQKELEATAVLRWSRRHRHKPYLALGAGVLVVDPHGFGRFFGEKIDGIAHPLLGQLRNALLILGGPPSAT
jgi:hypothetical protein